MEFTSPMKYLGRLRFQVSVAVTRAACREGGDKTAPGSSTRTCRDSGGHASSLGIQGGAKEEEEGRGAGGWVGGDGVGWRGALETGI